MIIEFIFTLGMLAQRWIIHAVFLLPDKVLQY